MPAPRKKPAANAVMTRREKDLEITIKREGVADFLAFIFRDMDPKKGIFPVMARFLMVIKGTYPHFVEGASLAQLGAMVGRTRQRMSQICQEEVGDVIREHSRPEFKLPHEKMTVERQRHGMQIGAQKGRRKTAA